MSQYVTPVKPEQVDGTDPSDFNSARRLVEQAQVGPDRVFAIFPDTVLTYGQLHERARTMAKGLLRLGVKRGDFVATLMPNCSDWVVAYFAGLMAGAGVAAINARYKRHELKYAIGKCDAKVLLTTDHIAGHVDFVELLGDCLPGLSQQADPTSLKLADAPDLRALVLMGHQQAENFLSEGEIAALGQAATDEDVDWAIASVMPDDTAAIIFTSGTTSMPKACELTHKGLLSSWLVFANTVGLAEGETVWMPMPFFHTGGVGPMTAILDRGAAFMTQPHYNAEQVVDLVRRHRIEHLYPGFPQLSLDVVDHPDFTSGGFDFVRSILNVGPAPMQRHIQGRMPEGALLHNLFGMTEGSGIVTFTLPDMPFERRAVSSGYPRPPTEVRVADPDTNIPVEQGQTGEIQFRGPSAFKAYYKDQAATQASKLADGWVKTGDRGQIETDGSLTFLGRIKDMMKVGGENVAAAEVEAFVQALEGVKMVQVIGGYDERLGEVPVAFVETAAGASLTEDDIILACDGQLSKWKIPRAVVFMTEWPMSATKVQKYKLRDHLPERFRQTEGAKA